MNNIRTFYLMNARGGYIYYSIVILLWIILIVFLVPLYTIIIGLIVQVIVIEIDGLKIEVHNDKLIIFKIFSKEKIISFDSIENVIKGRRTFYGQIFFYRDALIIPYTELSGYKCEFIDLYNKEMHTCIDSYFSAYKKLKIN